MSSPTELTPRMRQILDAAVTVAARSGLRGLTHRAVDAEARLPQGSTSAYLRTRLALLSGLTDHVAAQLGDQVSAVAAQIEESTDDAAVVGHAVDLFVGWLDAPDLLIARIELSREAMRQEELRELLRPGHDRLVATVAQTLERVDVDSPRTKARAIIAALDGLLVNALSEPAAERAAYVREMAALIIGAFISPRPAGVG